MSGERYCTTKIWPRPSSIGCSSADALFISMDPRGEPVISSWKRTCQKIQNGSEFPELVAQIFRNPQKCDNPGVASPLNGAFVGTNYDWPPSHLMPVLALFTSVSAKATAMTKERC